MKRLFIILVLCLPSLATVRNVKNTPCNAVGDGTTDDTASINTCISALVSGDTLLFPSGTYKTTSTLVITVSNVIIDGSNNAATIKCNGGVSCLNLGNSTLTASTQLTANAAVGATSFTANLSSLSIVAGSYVELEEGGVDVARSITDPLSCSTATPCRSEILRIASVAGTTANVDTTVQTIPGIHWPMNFQTPTDVGCVSPFTACPNANGAHVYRVQNPTTGVTLQNITLDGTGGSGEAGLFLLGLMNSVITGVTIKNFTNEGIGGFYDYNDTFTGILIQAAGAAGGHGAVNLKNEGRLIFNGVTLNTMRFDSWPWFVGGGADNTINNIEVDGGGVVTTRMFNVGAMSYSTFNGLNVHDASTSSIDNNISLQYYAQRLTFINSQSVVGGTTAGWMGFGNDNTFNTFINCSASGNTGWGMSVGRAPSDDTNWTVDGGTWSGLASPGNDVINFINSNHLIEGASISGPGGWGINFNSVTNSCINNNTFAGSSGLASGGIFTNSSTVKGSGNTMNGNSSTLTAGTCAVTRSPSTLTFGSQAVGTTSAPLAITLTNNTAASITLDKSYTIGDYAIQTNTCSGAIAAGGSCTISVTFTPTIVGIRSGYLLTYPTTTGGTTIVTLSGTGGNAGVGGGVVISGSVKLSGTLQISTNAGGGGSLAYAARTDNCACDGVAACGGGTESGCVGGRTTGEAGSGMSFLYRTTDTVPFANLAPANTAATDADFGTYMVIVTDPVVQGQTQVWIMGDTGEASSFSQDDSIFIARNNNGGAWLYQVIPSLIRSKGCTPGTPCVVQSQIHNGATDSTHLVTGGAWTFSGVLGESHVLYELAKSNTLIYRDVINTSGAPSTWTLTRSPYVDFTSDSPVPCSIIPASYVSNWSSTFTVGRDGSITLGSTGGQDWQASHTFLVTETFIMPKLSNAGSYGFQATAVSGPTGSVEPVWCQTLGCTMTDNGVTWTNIGKLGGQGPGFDIFSYQPGAGCSRINTRIGKIYRGTGNSQPAGNWTTDDTITCARLASSPPCPLGDTMTLHAAIQPFNGAFGQFGATGGGALSCMVPGTCSCAETNSNLIGAWSAVTAYAVHDLVYYSTVWYQSKTAHTSATTPDVDTTDWKVDDAYCYGYVWQKNSTMIRPCLELGAGRNSCDSHREVGYDSFYAGGQYQSHFWSQPMTATGTANPGVATIPTGLPGDRHNSYQNVTPGDKQPFLMFQTDVPTSTTNYIVSAYGEVIAVSTDGLETIYRFMHNYGTGSSPFFAIQNSIGDVSQDGTLAALGTDMMGTRGSASPDWAGTHLYALGDSIFPTTGNASNIEFQASVGGTSSNVEPTWSACVTTCVDGGVTWTNTTKSCNNLRALFAPAALTAFNSGDKILPLNAGGDIFQATTGTTGATIPSWSVTCPNYGNTCTDGTVTWTNLGPNTCRGDIVIADLLSAHAAP